MASTPVLVLSVQLGKHVGGLCIHKIELDARGDVVLYQRFLLSFLTNFEGDDKKVHHWFGCG